jgi:2-methylaconitate cis-trans-isomerase PrpF/2-methylcitrate dehydratase PrpD
MVRDDQIRIPAVYVRGGSSKAVILKKDDIPPPGTIRDRMLKRLMGSPDVIQIDGMGGAKAITSKIAILSPSTRADADIDYTFAQVGVRDDTIDYKPNCGNISAAVGPYAVDEGLVKSFRPGKSVHSSVPTQEVRIFHTGTKKILIAHVPINDEGHSIADGDFEMAAVPGSGAPILLDYRETIGAALSKGLLPTEHPIDCVEVGNRTVTFTLCDVANICVFATAAEFGVTGHESAAELTGNAGLVAAVKELRGKAAQMIGMCDDWKKVDEQSPFLPMVALIAPPPASQASMRSSYLSGRLFLDNMCHESMAGTISMCLGACSLIKGSVVFQQIGEAAAQERVLNIGHPLGIMTIAVEVENQMASTEPKFRTLSFVRTSRRLMAGHVYIPRASIHDQEDLLNDAVPNCLSAKPDVNTEQRSNPNAPVADLKHALGQKTCPDTEEEINVTSIFANFIANIGPKMLPQKLRDTLKEYLLDYIGVTVAAAKRSESTESIYNAVLALGGATGSCTVLVRGKSFTPQYAGLLNATCGHSMDFDDTYAAGSLHAGVSAISAGLTQAELMGSAVDSHRFLVAVAIGYEIICRLGRELGTEAYSRGFHNTATAGIFGAVATIAALKGLSAKTIENAFGLAASKAAGSMQYLENGSWNKRLHPGFAVHDAFVCVALAEAGVVGAAKSLEGKFGFLQAYSPKQDKDLRYLTDELGARWIFTETSLKPFPACRMTHGLIEMAGKYGYGQSSLPRREVESITVSVSPANFGVVGVRTPNKLHPKNVVDAQFSAYFQTSHAWLYGSNCGMQCYERLNDTNIHELSGNITCVADPAVTAMGSRMKIKYKSGHTEDVDYPFPLGEAEHPFTKDQINAKYFGLVNPIFGEARAIKIRDVVNELEKHKINSLLELLC